MLQQRFGESWASYLFRGYLEGFEWSYDGERVIFMFENKEFSSISFKNNDDYIRQEAASISAGYYGRSECDKMKTGDFCYDKTF